MRVISMFLVELVGLYRKAISRCFSMFCRTLEGFPGSSADKESACNTGDPDSIPGLGRSSENRTATHSSILAWRIPWTEETGRLWSMGLHRVGHDWLSTAQRRTLGPKYHWIKRTSFRKYSLPGHTNRIRTLSFQKRLKNVVDVKCLLSDGKGEGEEVV